MKRIMKTLAALLSAALLINSMFAVSTMKVYAEPAEENLSANELSTGTSEGIEQGITSGEGSTSGTTSNEGTGSGEGNSTNTGISESEGSTTDIPGTEDPYNGDLPDEEIALLLAGDNAVSVFAATRSTTPLGKFSMTFTEGMGHATVRYTDVWPAEDESWHELTWKDYTSGEVSATRVIVQPEEGYWMDGSVSVEGLPNDAPTPGIEELGGSFITNEEEPDYTGGIFLIKGCTYKFESVELKPFSDEPGEEGGPSFLTVAAYDDTNGKIEYLDEEGWHVVPNTGTTGSIKAFEVKAVYNDPYALKKYGREDEENGWKVSVTGPEGITSDELEYSKNNFVNEFYDSSAAVLEPDISYTLSGIDFVIGQGTFRWSYEVIKGHEDEYVGNGKIRIASAVDYTGATLDNSDEKYWKNNTVFNEEIDGNSISWNGGSGILPSGAIVTIELVPERGYQLTEFTINEQPNSTKAEGTISTFTFTVPNANFHLGAKFTPMADEVDSKVSGIAGGTLNIAQNEYANGTAALTVNNTSVSAEEESAFVANAQQAGFEVAKYVDLKLENRFYKGNTTDFWTTTEDKSNLNSPATISLSLSDITADDFEIVHQKHDGTYEVLDATYSNGNVTFSTNSFSKFAIVAKGMKTSSTPESGSTTPSSSSSSSDDSDDEDTASTVTTENNTSLGTVVGGSVVKDWDGLEKILENKTSTGNKTTDGNTTAAPIVLTLNQRNSTVPVSTLRALEASESVGLHLMMGNGVAITIANGAGLKNQPAINLSSKVETTRNSKTISFASNTKLNTLVALHMSVPKNVKEVKLYYYINGHAYFLGTLTTINGQVMFPISQLGIYKLVY